MRADRRGRFRPLEKKRYLGIFPFQGLRGRPLAIATGAWSGAPAAAAAPAPAPAGKPAKHAVAETVRGEPGQVGAPPSMPGAPQMPPAPTGPALAPAYVPPQAGPPVAYLPPRQADATQPVARPGAGGSNKVVWIVVGLLVVGGAVGAIVALAL